MHLQGLLHVLSLSLFMLLVGGISVRAENWPQYGHDMANSFVSSETWLTTTTARNLVQKWETISDNRVTSTPIVVNDTCYVGGIAQKVTAFRLSTGQVIWQTPVQGDIYGSPFYKDGRIYVGDTATKCYCLRATDGVILWTADVASQQEDAFFGSPVVGLGKVYLGVSNDANDRPCVRGRMVALNELTGAVVWRWYAVDSTATGGGNWNSALLDEATNRLYFTTGNPCTGPPSPYTDAVICLNANTGALNWASQVIANDTGDHDFGSAPCFFTSNGTPAVGAGCKNGYFYAFNRDTGAFLWRTQIMAQGYGDILPAAAALPDRIVIGTGHTLDGYPGSVCALSTANGNLLWQYKCQAQVYGNVAVTNGVVFFAHSAGRVIALNAATGDSLWGNRLSADPILGGPSVSHGYMLIASYGDGVHAYSFPVVPTDVADDGATSHIGAVRLSAVHAQDGRILFTVEGATDTNARIEVYDMSGRTTVTLALTPSADAIGSRTATWSARGGRGRPVARGVYLARVTGTAATVKVAIARGGR
jgi:polyvinyl alcohol dehydrogenase (cytochrome)